MPLVRLSFVCRTGSMLGTMHASHASGSWRGHYKTHTYIIGVQSLLFHAPTRRGRHTAAAVPSTVIYTATDTTIAVCTRRCTCMYPTSCVGGADRAGVDGVGCAPSAVLAGVVLVLSVGSAHAARPWSVQFGGCVFSGDYDGAPLVRSGSCATKGPSLNLYDRGITSVKSDSFADMGACQ